METNEQRDAARRASLAVKDAEQGALERGNITVADLMRADAWAIRVAHEEAELAKRAADGVARATEAKDGEAAARATVAGRRADAELVEKHRERWDGAERARDAAKEEEAAAEAWRPKS